jgi:fimbrial isopeptide formation D2 family protein
VGKSGDVVTYTVVLNVSSNTANAVTVVDQLPSYMTFVSFGNTPSSATAQDNGQTLTWAFSPLSSGTAVTMTYQASVNADVPGGTAMTNTATLTYAGLSTPKTAIATVTVSGTYLVHLAVYNSVGELIKQILIQTFSEPMNSITLEQTQEITSLNGVVYIIVNGQAIASWNGTDQNGNPVSNGQYYIKLDSEDPEGITNSVSAAVVVNRTLTEVEAEVFNSAGEVVRHLYSYVDDPNGVQMTDIQLSSTIINPGNTSGQGAPGTVNVDVITNVASAGLTLSWDGRADTGSTVANGQYTLEVHWSDATGDTVITRSIVVLGSSNSPAGGKVYAYPQILGPGQTSTQFKINSDQALTLMATVYDIAGERIEAPVTGLPGSNLVNWSASRLASGIYIAVVEMTDSNGLFVDRQVTKIIVRH